MPITLTGVSPLFEIFDLPASIAFYCDILGFEMVNSAPCWCMLRLGDVTLMLNTAYDEGERPPVPEPRRVRGHSDAALYLNTPDPDAVYALLRARGWKVDAPQDMRYGMRQVNTRDPDGFLLCFICPLESA